MIESVIKPKGPKSGPWRCQGPAPWFVSQGYASMVWTHGDGFRVISAVEVVGSGPEYHISVSYKGGRCTRNQSGYVLKAFGMTDAIEDNHVPGGYVRNYWLPVADKYKGVECDCVDTETAISEDKGDYIWRGVE